MLDDKVLEDPAFASKNPSYIKGKPCLYVGMTTIGVENRFLQHKKGEKANKHARDFGLQLLPDLYGHLNAKDMFSWEAKAVEKQLAERLRSQGYAVWQN